MRLRKTEIYELSGDGSRFNTYIIHGYSSYEGGNYEDLDASYLRLIGILACNRQHIDCTMRLFRDLK